MTRLMPFSVIAAAACELPPPAAHGLRSAVRAPFRLARAAHQLHKTVKTFLEGPSNTVRHIKDENGRFGLGVVVSRPLFFDSGRGRAQQHSALKTVGAR